MRPVQHAQQPQRPWRGGKKPGWCLACALLRCSDSVCVVFVSVLLTHLCNAPNNYNSGSWRQFTTSHARLLLPHQHSWTLRTHTNLSPQRMHKLAPFLGMSQSKMKSSPPIVNMHVECYHYEYQLRHHYDGSSTQLRFALHKHNPPLEMIAYVCRRQRTHDRRTVSRTAAIRSIESVATNTLDCRHS